jgi:hypothetical protein
MNCLPARQVSDRELRSVSLNSHSYILFLSLFKEILMQYKLCCVEKRNLFVEVYL